MIDKKIIIAGIVRNNAQYLSSIFKNIEMISSLFKEVKCIFVESDSNDNSLNLLNEFKNKNKNVDVISMGNLRTKMPYRTQRTAFCY